MQAPPTPTGVTPKLNFSDLFGSRRLIVLLAGCIVLLGLMTGFANRSMHELTEDNAWLTHSELVRLQIGEVLQLLTDVETAERGYAITHDAGGLTPYEAAVPALPPQMVRLQRLIDDNPVQRQLAGRLAGFAQERIREGLITLAVSITARTLVLSVRDTGMGLASDMLTRVFEMFSQVDAHDERSEGGLGIGLALVRGLVELHGGHVEARSAGLERGTEFVVTLPGVCVAGASHPTLGLQNAGPQRRIARRVLVADDNRDGAESLGMLLQLAGHEVHIAHTGPEALRLAAQYRPHLAILDIGMPGMSGYEVAEQIRREPWGAGIRLIALTGRGQDDDKRHARRAGFDLHWTKPLDPEALAELSLPAEGP